MCDVNNNNSKKAEDDPEKMRLAFEAFMLTGKNPTTTEEKNGDDDLSSSMATSSSNKSKKKKKKKKSSSMGGGGSGGTPPKPRSSTPSKASSSGGSGINNTNNNHQLLSSPSATKQSASLAKADKKRYYQLLRLFNDKVQHTWLDIDDQILAILQNIVSIRGRLPLEWKLLNSSSLRKEEASPEDEEEWKYHGLLGKPKETPYSLIHLHMNDVQQLALSNDLIQHEKMLAGVRSSMTNLAECHDGLGRVVDNLFKFHLECIEEITIMMQEEDGSGNESVSVGGGDGGGDLEEIVQSVTEVYRMLSMELYRKQSLVPLLIDTTEDEVLGVDKNDTDYGKGGLLRQSVVASDNMNGLSGIQLARKFCKSWKRDSEESCIDENMLSQILKLGDPSQQNNG